MFRDGWRGKGRGGFRSFRGALVGLFRSLVIGVPLFAAFVHSPLADYLPALWLARPADTLKLDVGSGEPLFAISEPGRPRVLAVDPLRGRLWSYRDGNLSAYAFDGTSLSRAPLPGRGSDPADLPVSLEVMPRDGTPWLAVGRRLHRLDAEGAPLAPLITRSPVHALAAIPDNEPMRDWMVAALDDRLRAYNRHGGFVGETRYLGRAPLRDIAWSPVLQQLWGVAEDRLQRFTRNGRVVFEREGLSGERLAVDGGGGLWLSDGSRLRWIDRHGEGGRELHPFGEQASIAALVTDFTDGGVWALAGVEWARIAPGGIVERRHSMAEIRSMSSDGEGSPAAALAFYSDLIPPQLEVVAPKPGARLAERRPWIQLHAIEEGSGIDRRTLRFSVDGVEIENGCYWIDGQPQCRPLEPLAEGRHHFLVELADRAGNPAKSRSFALTIDASLRPPPRLPPELRFSSPPSGALLGDARPWIELELRRGSSAIDLDTLEFRGDDRSLSVDCEGPPGALRCRPERALAEGAVELTAVVVDRNGLASAPAAMRLTIDTIAPAAPDAAGLLLSRTVDGELRLTGGAGAVEPFAQVSVAYQGRSERVDADTAGAFGLSLSASDGATIALHATDAAGNRSPATYLTVDAVVPPDPVESAPKSTPGDFSDSVAFLFEGPAPVQTGVTPGVIEEKRVTVLRGGVDRGEGVPLPGVIVSIQDHPEWGRTVTRADGRFDLAVNGGGVLTVLYRAEGYLPTQRQVKTAWGEFIELPEVTLAALDPVVTRIELGAEPDTLVVAQGSAVADESGERQATLLVPGDVEVTLTLPDGSTRAVESLSVRATEYTVGEEGPSRMPGPLPPTSGYTYAVELSADEALTAGATRVDFDQPIPVYVDNFLGFPVGEPVPAGWYDAERSAWIPADDGRIIGIVSVTDGVAAVDIDGDGAADDGARLTALGITEKEQRRLAELYPAGKSLWRIPVEHFTPWDFNWPVQPPPDAEPPPEEAPPESETDDIPDSDDSTHCSGCIIDVQSQVLGEDIPLVGTPFSLHYRSDRSRGKLDGRAIEITLTDNTVSPSLLKVELIVTVAGQIYRREFAPVPNLTHLFVWDGLDSYGRPVAASAEAVVEVNYHYPMAYYSSSSDSGRSFGRYTGGDMRVLATRSDQLFTEKRTWTKQLTSAYSLSSRVSLGGWSLSPLHEFDQARGTLYLGSGARRELLDGPGLYIDTATGGGRRWPVVDGEDAAEFELWTHGVDVTADGTLYGGDYGYIYRVDRDNRLTIVAGNGDRDARCEGGNARETPLDLVFDIKSAPDGGFYFIDNHNCLRKLAPEGVVEVVAGSDESLHGGDGGAALEATFTYLESMDVAPDGSVYLTDANRIRRIGPDGVIHTIAGAAEAGYAGDGGPAAEALLDYPTDVAIAPDGSVYIADTGNACIRRIDNAGMISTVAGVCGTTGGLQEGVPATESYFEWPWDIAFGPDGSLYVADVDNSRVAKVGRDGILNTAAGGGWDNEYGWGVGVSVSPARMVFSPDGALILSQVDDAPKRLTRNVGLPLIPSADASRIYRFEEGRHAATLDALTGSEQLRFAFDDDGRLLTVATVDGEVTAIERDGEGQPRALIAPNGQRTELRLDDDGHLSEIINPAGERYQFSYTETGLLTATTDPLGRVHRYTYDGMGRLVADRDPLGGGWELTKSRSGNTQEVLLTSAEGRTARFSTTTTSTGARIQTHTSWDGTEVTTTRYPDGYRTTEYPDGGMEMEWDGPDSRFGMAAPVPWGRRTTMDGAWSYDVDTERTIFGGDPNDPLSFTSIYETRATSRGVTHIHYWAEDRTRTVTVPGGRTTITTLDEKGRAETVQTPHLGTFHFDYDERGRLRSAEASDGDNRRTTRYFYDELGNLSAVEGPLGHRAETEYDLAGRPLRRRLPDGRSIAYTYDAAGNLRSLTTPAGRIHRFTYDERDLEAAYAPPALDPESDPTTHHRYNLDKELVELIRPDGQRVHFDYDDGRHLVALHQPRGTTQYTYDHSHWGSKKLTGVTAPDGGTLALTYSGPFPESEQWSGEIEGSVSRELWSDTPRLKRLMVNGEAVLRDYMSDGQLLYAGDLDMFYSPATGRFVGTALDTIDTYRDHNRFGELTEESVEVSGVAIFDTRYSRDPLGRIVEKVESLDGPTRTERYTYDAAGRLTEVERDGALTRYTYDANGNRLARESPDGTETGTYDAQDRLITYGDANYEYTANGDLLTRTDTDGTTTYDYDLLGNLMSVELPDTTRIDYLVDGRNRRIGKKIEGTLVQGFLYQDDLNPIAELDGANNVVSRFVYADKPNVPAYMIRGGVTYSIISDHLGSPRLVIDSATGTVVQRMEYDEFGRVITDTNPGFQPFGFAGGLFDHDTGLVRFGARDYDPWTGRWTSKDPIRFGGGINLYQYALNNPLNIIDPLGLWGEGVEWTVIGNSAAPETMINGMPSVGQSIIHNEWIHNPKESGTDATMAAGGAAASIGAVGAAAAGWPITAAALGAVALGADAYGVVQALRRDDLREAIMQGSPSAASGLGYGRTGAAMSGINAARQFCQ